MVWHSARSTRSALAALLLPALALLSGAPRSAISQTLTTVQNSKIVAIVGQEDDLNGVNVAGRFGILQAGQPGGVLLELPRSTALNQLGSYVTVRIDGGTPLNADGTVAEDVPGWDIAWGYEDTPDTDITGEWMQIPTVVSPTKIVAKWRTVPDAAAEPPIPEIQVDLTMTLIYDMVSYRFTIINKDVRAHSVGLRFAQDFAVPQSTDGPIRTPRTGLISNETELFSTVLPAWWRAVAAADGSSVGGVLLPSGASTNPTRPDRIVFARTATIVAPLWDVTLDGTESFVGPLLDGSAATYYNPVQLTPGERKEVSMYLGAAGATYDFGQRLVAGLEGPSSLQYDPSKPQDEQLQPNPMVVTAFLHNMNEVALRNVRAVLSVPTGLRLANGESAVKTAASVATDTEVTFTWRLVPTGEASGRLTYSVAFSADPGGQGVSVARDVDIPALPSQELPGGWQMVSFPYVLADQTPAGAINLSPAMYDLVRWSPGVGQYQAVQFISPGEGYWLRLSGASTITLNDPHPVNAATGDFQVKLERNWNQIGNPFLLPVRWADVRVINMDESDPDYLRPLSVQEAAGATRQWISAALFRYDLSALMYKWDQDFSTDLVPFVGYWVKALKPKVELLIPQPTGRSAKAVVSSVSPARRGGWSLRIAATDGRTTDGWNFIGVAPDAGDGYDMRDVAKPPALADGVRMAIMRTEWGDLGGAFAQDMQSATGGAKEWRIVVGSSGPDADVTVTWPDIASLPKTHELFISDDGGGPRRMMRQMSSLRLNTGPTGTRSITITAEPRTAGGAFRLTSWNVATSRAQSGATISVMPNQTATVTVRVIGPNGVTVRRLTSRAATGGQLTQLTWDFRNGAGISVPAGSYNVEIKAVTVDGQSARVVAPLVVTR